MQQLTQYTDTCLEVGQEMQVQAQAAVDAGIEPWRIILDPGNHSLADVTSVHTCSNTDRHLSASM